MRYLLIASVLLVLSGCAAFQTQESRLYVACQTYTSTLFSLAAAKDSLTDEQIQKVNRIRSIANPICYKGKLGPHPVSTIIRLTRKLPEAK